MTQQPNSILVMGATGQIGRVPRRWGRDVPPDRLRALWQSRRPEPAFPHPDILAEPCAAGAQWRFAASDAAVTPRIELDTKLRHALVTLPSKAAQPQRLVSERRALSQ